MPAEDDLRAALRTLETHAPDPDAVLFAVRARAATPTRRRPGLGRNPGPVRWHSRITPLAAAVATAAVVAGSVLAATVYGPARTGGKAGNHSSAPPFPTTSKGLPAYFAQTPIGSQTRTLRIIATATGNLAAAVTLPGRIATTAASDGAFFAAVTRGSQKSFYEIRLRPGGRGAGATLLPIPPMTAAIGFIAASPDGSKLAISTFGPPRRLPYGVENNIQNLIVASTGTGAERQWVTPPSGRQGSMDLMSWLADGKTLAFGWTGAAEISPSTSLRLLDTTAPGTNLLASRPVLRNFNRAGDFTYTMSPDGKVVIGIEQCLPGCGPGSPGTVQGHRPALGSVIEFAAATGSPRVLYQQPPLPGTSPRYTTCSDPLWISKTGSKLLLYCFQHRPAGPGRSAVTNTHVILLADGRVAQQLPWLATTVNDIAEFPGITNAAGGFPALPYPTKAG